MLAALALSAAWAGAPDAIDIPHTTYVLDNGLHVILAPDASTPVVHVNLWYHVGSADELPGLTGFAHLFEHLMFQGSLSAQGEYFDLLEKVGADLNGTTSFDRTNFYETVPAEYLPLALYLESDRMGWLLDVLDQSKLDNQREVVRNERRQNYENPPYGAAFMDLLAAVYPEGHPYHHVPIGSHEDLQRASVDDVKAFFRTWYTPDNASLVIAGDFDPKVAKRLVAEYFSGIPEGTHPARNPTADAPILATKKIVQYQSVPQRKVWLAWESPALYAEGDAEMDLFSQVVGAGQDSRLYAKVVKELRVAKAISVSQQSMARGSLFVINATAAEGHTTDEVVAAVDQVMADVLGEHPPTTDEIEMARAQFEVGFYDRIATIAGKADALNGYQTLAGDPGYIATDLQRYADADPAAVLAAAKAILGKPRVELDILPLADQPPPVEPPPAPAPAPAPVTP